MSDVVSNDETPHTRKQRLLAAYYQAHKDDVEEWGKGMRVRSERRRLAAMVSTRFTAEEADAIREKAQRYGLSVSGYMRRAALERDATITVPGHTWTTN